MAIITRIVQGKKNPNRVNLYLDGSYAFALSIDEVGKHSLKKGLELTDIQINDLKENDQTDYVYAKILNFLSFRPRTVKEVRDRLRKYEVVDKAKQNSIIDRLTGSGYLDDIAFARWFIESRNTHRPRSPLMLSQELMSKGVARADIDAVIGEVSSEDDSIKQILAKKIGTPRTLQMTEKQKLFAHLGRLGYSWEAIKKVVKSWESE